MGACFVKFVTFFVISTSVIDCLGRFVPEMTYYVSSGTLNLTKLKPNQTVSESLQGALSPSLPWFSFADNYISH